MKPSTRDISTCPILKIVQAITNKIEANTNSHIPVRSVRWSMTDASHPADVCSFITEEYICQYQMLNEVPCNTYAIESEVNRFPGNVIPPASDTI